MWSIEPVRHAGAAFLGFGSGLVISGAVFAFIAAIGVVTRLAQKAGARRHIWALENAVLAGGAFGAVNDVVKISIPVPGFIVAFFALCVGVFYGAVAASLAEVVDMLPILTRRGRLTKGIFWFVAAIAAGKAAGALLYGIAGGFGK